MDPLDDDEEDLIWAYEQGYRQGRNDEKEGIFIHWNTLAANFLAALKLGRLQPVEKEKPFEK